MCTALDQQDLVNEALEVGAKNYIVKPFGPGLTLHVVGLVGDIRPGPEREPDPEM